MFPAARHSHTNSLSGTGGASVAAVTPTSPISGGIGNSGIVAGSVPSSVPGSAAGLGSSFGTVHPPISSSSVPQFLANTGRHRSSKSQSSLLRISTNNTGAGIGDFHHYPASGASSAIAPGPAGGEEQSLRLTDRIPSTRPLVTASDKLWTQIDVLDDVKDMSHQVKLRGSFFNDSFNEELNKLKTSQNQLLEIMASQHSKIKDIDLQKQMYKLSLPNSSKQINSSQILSKAESNLGVNTSVDISEDGEKINSFFTDAQTQLQNILHRKQDLQELDKYIEETRLNLNVVGQAMKNFDETTKELW